MRLKLLIVFLLIVIIPMITLGWFSVKSAQDQREIHKHRIIALITQNLASLDESIAELVKSYERKLNKLDSVKNYSVRSLRKLVRSIPAVHQLLILDKRGKRIFPSHFSFTQPERDFILRSKPFIETFLKDNNRESKNISKFRTWQHRAKSVTEQTKSKKKPTARSKLKKSKKSDRRTPGKQSYDNIRIEQHLYANTSRRKAAIRRKTKSQKSIQENNKHRKTAKRSKQSQKNKERSQTRKPPKTIYGKTNYSYAKTKTLSYGSGNVLVKSDRHNKTRPTSRPSGVASASKLSVTDSSHKTLAKKSISGKDREITRRLGNNKIARAKKQDHRNLDKKPEKSSSKNWTPTDSNNSTVVIRRPFSAPEKLRTAATKKPPLKIVTLSKKQKRIIAQEERKKSNTSISPIISGKVNSRADSGRLQLRGFRQLPLPAKGPQKKESVFQDLRGWSIGFRKNGINLIYSYRKSDGYLIAAEISRTRLIADIILLLPTPKSQNKNSAQSLITLTNARGDIVYQWGYHKPKTKSKPLVSYNLAVPLNTWKLNYYSPKIDLDNTASYAPFALGLSTVFFAVFGLAFYFYRESNRELTVASQRVTFVNQVSHELKTPLTNIRMYAELLEEDLEDTNDKTRDRMQVIVNESQRLSRMIINVLNFARHQRQQLTVIRSLRVVDDIIRHVLDQVKPALERQNIEIDFTANANSEINIDADVLEQILHNLISNVEKYASAGHYLGISSNIYNGIIEIILSDKGPGIPRHMVSKIFDAFYRGDDQLSEGVSGTGIGLSISRELARLHGGDLKLTNNQQGITFKLTLNSEAK